MNEQPSNQEVEKTPEKTPDQLYEELNQAFDKSMKLMEQVHELEMKTFDSELAEEERNAIIAERDKLAIQRDQAWEAEKALEKEWKKEADRETAELEKKYKSLEE